MYLNKLHLWLLSILLLLKNGASAEDSKQEPTRLSPQQALERLMQGNERYKKDALLHPDRTIQRREAVRSRQLPFAIIIGCSDSRVPPEIIFDQGVGDLFVVRVAGNVIGPLELDSIDYSALILKSSVILVMGHENCGAVDAVIQNNTDSIQAISVLVSPAVAIAKEHSPHNLLEASVKMNALRMKEYLMNTRFIKKLIEEKNIEVHAAYYHLHTGEVELLK